NGNVLIRIFFERSRWHYIGESPPNCYPRMLPASRQPPRKTHATFYWSHLPGLNRGPRLYESRALPTELRWRKQEQGREYYKYSLFQLKRLYTASMSDKAAITEQIAQIEAQMASPDFWADKDKAQEILKEYQDLKARLEGNGGYDKSDALVTIVSGA